MDEKATALPAPADLPDSIHSRSVTLASEELHVIAKMDLVEAEGGVVTPVDSAGTTVHNFWTTVPIRTGASYRFRAQGGIASPVEAVVRVPADYRMEVLLGLIRSLDDRGLLALMDNRILKKQYGKVFLESLPKYRRTTQLARLVFHNFFSWLPDALQGHRSFVLL